MTGGLPFDDFRKLLGDLPGADEDARAEAAQRGLALSAQGVGLGRLGEIAQWLAAWTGRPPQVVRPVVSLFAGTHEVDRHLPFPLTPADIQARVEFCAAGGAAINQLCAANDLGLKIFDLALDLPVADITREAAFDERACAATMAFGMEAISGGADLVCLGDLGAGGVSAAAILAALHGGDPARWTEGEGPQAAVAQALALHGAHLADPLEVLRRLGGREIAAIAGAILAARMERTPVILDGYAATAAAAVLRALDRHALDHCLLAHVPAAGGHARSAKALALEPLLDLRLGDGEGVGAALAAGLVRNAAAVHSGMHLKE